MKRYDFLLGLNFLAIFLIIIDHFVFKKQLYTHQTFPYTFFRDGMNGIFLLFVTTGFWVTKEVFYLKDNKAFNPFKYSLVRFLKRFPIFAAYISYVWFSGLFDNVTKESVLSAYTTTFNYLGGPHSDVLMHFWAFSAKENVVFLLFIPIFAFCNKKFSLLLMLLLGILSIYIRADWFYSGDVAKFDWWKYIETHILLYCFTIPAIVALLEDNMFIKNLFLKFKLVWFAFILLIIIGPYLESKFVIPYAWVYKSIVATIGFSLICGHCMYKPDGLLSRFLSNRIFVIGGSMYVSVYLWQQPYTFYFFDVSSPLSIIPQYVGIGLAMGIGAYLILELPIRKLIKKFS